MTTITFTDEQLKILQIALSTMERAGLGQFNYALEHLFPKKSLDLGFPKLGELNSILKKEFFPEYPGNSGPGISIADKKTKIAYEMECVISQFLALKESGGYFGRGSQFSSPLELSGEPMIKIDGHEELTYKDYKLPENHQEFCLEYFRAHEYEKIWKIVHTMDIPYSDGSELMEGMTDDEFCGHPYIFVRVYKPRLKIVEEF